MSHMRVSDVRGYSRLAFDATLGITRLVEAMHHNIARRPGILGPPVRGPAPGVTGFVYRSIRGITRLIGASLDLTLAAVARMFDGNDSSTERDAVLSAVNGVIGDHLVATANPLAIPMHLRRGSEPLELTGAGLGGATGKILLLVHGLCMNDRHWQQKRHDHAAALAADEGVTPIHVRYNSGLHVSTNGRALADQLEALVKAWPVPIETFAVLAHSMGGLVMRSAVHYGALAHHEWIRHLRHIVFLGTPHGGAPLERAGNWIDRVLDASPYTSALAGLGKMRSAGITDLRFGSVLDDDWQGTDRFARRGSSLVALPSGIACYAVAATLSKRAVGSPSRLLGDGLVPLDSALGKERNGHGGLSIPESRQWIAFNLNHLDLLSDKQVYARIRDWLRRAD